MRVYISGPITGIENSNKPAFEAAKKNIKTGWGFDVVTPFDNETPEETAAEAAGPRYGEAYWKLLAKDVLLLGSVDGIVLLPGWEDSKGARLEAYVALIKGMPIMGYSENVLEELDKAGTAGVCVTEFIPKEILQRLGLAA